MTYEGGSYFADGLSHTRVGYFSTPSVSAYNVATGHATDGDNARTLREVKHVIAGYRSNNEPPTTPVLISPQDGASEMKNPVLLQASTFFDTDGDSHSNSQWQVDRSSSFEQPAWDSGDSFAPTVQVTIPQGALRGLTTYYWHVRYKDSRGLWSSWSSARSFTTGMNADFDGDLDVDLEDFSLLQICLTGTNVPQTVPSCAPAKLDGDEDVDESDLGLFQACMSGPDSTASSACVD
jgi:hypothetical protein